MSHGAMQCGDGGHSTPTINAARVYRTQARAQQWLDDRRDGTGARPLGEVVPVFHEPRRYGALALLPMPAGRRVNPETGDFFHD